MFVGHRLEPLQQGISKAGEAEEVVGLRHLLDWPADLAFVQVGLGDISLVRHRIQPFVGVLVDVSVVVAALQEALDGLGVAWLGGADEVVIVDVQLSPGLLEPLAGDIGLLLGGAVVGRGGVF